MKDTYKGYVFVGVYILLIILLASFSSAYKPHTMNTDLKFSITSNFATTCYLTDINTPNGVVWINQTGTKQDQTFNYTIASGNYSTQGEYCHNIVCTDGTDYTSGQECREVNYTGTTFDLQDTYVYIIALVALVTSIVFLYFVYNRINGEHGTDEGGNLVFINFKGLLKPIVLCGIWIIVLAALFIISNMGLAFLPNPMIGNLFLTIYKVLFWGTIIGVPLLGIMLLVKAVRMLAIQKIIDRGGLAQQNSKF